MEQFNVIEVKRSIFDNNNEDAQKLREQLKKDKTCLINLMSSPGAGKTTTLLSLIERVKGKIQLGIMEADIDSAVDARKIYEAGIKTIQLHTGGMCHLDADMTRQGLQKLDIKDLDLVILENVGNLVCPAEFDTGAVKNVTILSIPEGDDKPLKYPLMYEVCDLMIVNKIDVLPYFDFNQEKVVEYVKMRNPNIKVIFVSAITGEGMEEVVNWFLEQVNNWVNK